MENTGIVPEIPVQIVGACMEMHDYVYLFSVCGTVWQSGHPEDACVKMNMDG